MVRFVLIFIALILVLGSCTWKASFQLGSGTIKREGSGMTLEFSFRSGNSRISANSTNSNSFAANAVYNFVGVYVDGPEVTGVRNFSRVNSDFSSVIFKIQVPYGKQRVFKVLAFEFDPDYKKSRVWRGQSLPVDLNPENPSTPTIDIEAVMEDNVPVAFVTGYLTDGRNNGFFRNTRFDIVDITSGVTTVGIPNDKLTKLVTDGEGLFGFIIPSTLKLAFSLFGKTSSEMTITESPPTSVGHPTMMESTFPVLTSAQLKTLTRTHPVYYGSIYEDQYNERVNSGQNPFIGIQAILNGTPVAMTFDKSINVTVSGNNVTQYRYKIDNLNWSNTKEISQNISVNTLPAGSRTLYVIGGDNQNNWQHASLATRHSWTITETKLYALPTNPTNAQYARVYVGGTGITHYRYQHNSNTWSSEIEVGTPIIVTNLPEGSHFFRIKGKNQLEQWQPTALEHPWIVTRRMSYHGWIGGGNTIWALGEGTDSGTGLRYFNRPHDVFVNKYGRIIISDKRNHRISNWKGDASAVTIAGGGTNGWHTGSTPMSMDYLSFAYPSGLFVDFDANILVADSFNNRVKVMNKDASQYGWIGGGFTGWKTTSGPGTQNYTDGNFYNPTGLVKDSEGNIYIADLFNHRVQKWTSSGTYQGWIGNGNNGWRTGDAPDCSSTIACRIDGSLYMPSSVALGPNGELFISEYGSHRVSKWENDGTFIGWIGNAVNGWQTGETPVSAGCTNNGKFLRPTSLFLDTHNNIYVADAGNHRIQKWDSNGVCLGWIGGGSPAYKSGFATSSAKSDLSFEYPTGVFADPAGNVFIADSNNNRIMKVNSYATTRVKFRIVYPGVNTIMTGDTQIPKNVDVTVHALEYSIEGDFIGDVIAKWTREGMFSPQTDLNTSSVIVSHNGDNMSGSLIIYNPVHGFLETPLIYTPPP